MSELADFLGARLDEQEARADALFFACRIPGRLPDFSSCGGSAAEAYWQHFTPDRILRDVEADRKLIQALTHPDPLQGPEYAFGLRLAAMFRTEVYSDHPDYQPGWKP